MKRKIISILTVLIMGFTVFAITPGKTSAASDTYWLKVNVQRNVVNVYKLKNGDWKPYRVMLCSCGKSETPTPIGTYSVKKKWRWVQFKSVAGQYVTQFNGNYLFHSDIYSKYGVNSSCIRSAYNKLGSVASHGCVRMAVMDAKWVYENCSWGTKVTTYKSSKAGPLGKPKRVKMAGSGSTGWDPTDPQGDSKHFKLKGPTIKIKKKDTIKYGAKFKIKKGVTAKSKYTRQNLTSKVKVAKVMYKAEGAEKFVKLEKKKVNTKKPGKYRIKYTCYDKYCGPKKVKTFKLTVLPQPEPPTEPTDPTDPTDQTDQTDTSETTGPVETTDPTGSGDLDGTDGSDVVTDPTEPAGM